MAEDYEPYHVPQHSRREKLRVIAPHNNLNFSEPSGLLPLYDPGLLQVDFHKQEEGPNFMGFIGGMMNASGSHHPHQPYEIQPSVLMNPNQIHEINGNPFLYSSQNLRDFDFNGEAGATMLSFKPQSMGHEVNGTGQGLSLSLSTQQGNLPQELNLHRYQSAMIGEHYTAPLGPFTGYASILGASRFLRPAQQLLEEFCDVGQNGVFAERINSDVRATDASLDAMNVSGVIEESFSCGDTREQQKKSRLISMLEEVYRRYKQYYQQLQAVMASFESVAGLANAAPFAHLAVKGMSKNFRCLKNAIMDQLQLANRKNPGQGSQSKDDKGIYAGQRPVHNPGFLDQQPVWRPQRGLPERAVTVLRAWLFEHFLHPYPTDTDKLMLAKQTGLSRSQVSNWFINARVRLWKPMVEEIHLLETRQSQKAPQPREERNTTSRPSELSENASTSAPKLVQGPHSKHCKHDMTDVAMANEEGMHIYDDLSNPTNIGAPVSLTLGLHQNNVVALSDQFSLNDQGFGLGNSREGYGSLGGFEGHSRHYGRDIMGGQLLHDFVG